jgi:8-oxo-dGTP diphosphatase
LLYKSTKGVSMLYVTCALLWHKGLVLAAQRSESMSLPLKWELPGGKLEQGETPVAGLIREMQEELSIDVEPIHPLPPAPYLLGQRPLTLLPYVCTYNGVPVTPLEHKQVVWLPPSELHKLDWAEADIAVIDSFINWLT